MGFPADSGSGSCAEMMESMSAGVRGLSSGAKYVRVWEPPFLELDEWSTDFVFL